MSIFIFFFFNDTATTEIYTLSLHDALPIWRGHHDPVRRVLPDFVAVHGHAEPDHARHAALVHHGVVQHDGLGAASRSEEHTSELQSRLHLVCRLLLEKKKKTK